MVRAAGTRWTWATSPGKDPPEIVVTEVPHACCTPFAIDVAEVPHLASGAVYRSNGSLVAASQRAGHRGADRVASSRPTHVRMPRDLDVLPGRWLYGGHWMNQFGHFLTETLTSLWPLLHDTACDGLVFHPFTFGSTVQPWQEEFLRLLGAAGIPVAVINEPVRVEHLLVPSRPFTPSHSATAEAVAVWQHTVRDLTPPQSHDLVFLSRSHLARDLRRLTGDLAMEQLLSERGFQIVHPETMTVTEQLGLVRHARVLAGVSGSSLHLSAFADRATRVIEIGDRRTATRPLRNQRVIDSACGRRSVHIPLKVRDDGGRDAPATAEAIARLISM